MGKRRQQEEGSAPKSKKPKLDNPSSQISPDASTDFPRGGGTTLAPSEVKSLKAEARKQADDLFKDAKKSRKSNVSTGKQHGPRVERLTHKRLTEGVKLLGQIIAVLPLALVISLPDQLYGHVPITNISSQLTSLLEQMDAAQESDPDSLASFESHIPQLSDMFSEGQFVRAVVNSVGGTSGDVAGLLKSRDDATRASRRIELSLVPEKVNAGVQISDLSEGITLTAAIQSIEDHGYTVDLGIPKLGGFLPSKDVEMHKTTDRLWVGQVVNVTVSKVKTRTCALTIEPSKFASVALKEVTTGVSILPGMQVQCLVTDSHSGGVLVQVLGYFEGSIEPSHLSPSLKYTAGKKIKARVLYATSSSPPRFALATTNHLARLDPTEARQQLTAATDEYPIGTLVEAATITRVDSEHGIFVKFGSEHSGFIHISQVSDDHVASLLGTRWKVGSSHKARIVGYHPFDQVFQLSLKPSVLNQKFMRLEDLKVGAIVKGTVKALKDNALFVALSDNLDGVVWPNHFADVALKNPARRFKEGEKIKSRVLLVDTEQKKLYLTCKKSLIDSDLPIVSSLEEVPIGLVTLAVVSKVFEKHAFVEFFNHIQALVPSTEVSDDPTQGPESLVPGRVVKVRVIAFDETKSQITASIRQARIEAIAPMESLEVGHLVKGSLLEVQKKQAVLALQPSGVRAMLSLENLANHRGITAQQIHSALKIGETFENLVVVSRNAAKGFVVVANKPKAKKSMPKLPTVAISLDTVQPGDVVSGRVTRHLPQAALLKVSSHIGAILHRVDIADDYDIGADLPQLDSTMKAVVLSVNRGSRQLVISTRKSRLSKDERQTIVDPEIDGLSSLGVGQTVRGFVKQVADSGLFVSLGRNLTARVLIRELFDEFVKDWQSRFQPGQLVKGKVKSLDGSADRVELTLRSKPSEPEKSVTLSSLSVLDKVTGTVSRVEEYGLFIQIANSKLSGLCHKSELTDNPEADVAAALSGFRIGDRVRALILKIENNKISLSLKKSHFEADDAMEEGDEEEPQQENMELEAGSPALPSESEDEEDSDVEMEAPSTSFPTTMEVDSPHEATTLKLNKGFKWSVETPENDGLSSSSDLDSESEADSKPRQRKKRKAIQQDLTADMATKLPESNDDFERILLSSPDSSFLWMKYMSFQLQLSEIDKAREIARRALRTINFREEQERLNVWTALLNLENAYGTAEDLEKTLREAARANDAKTIHLRMATIFQESDKLDLAEQQFQRACKKFGHSSKVWTLFGEFYFRRGNLDGARALLPRSFQSLEKRKHIKTISRFAQLEYKLGDAERGKTIFEGIVESHPKRWDLWSVYIDMEISLKDIVPVRSLFHRLFEHKLTARKAKFFFKKWLAIEKKFGDEANEDLVKDKAIAWTQAAKSKQA